MRIAMLGHKWIPCREGGIEVVVENLAVRMVEMGHHVSCYNRGRRGERPKEYRGIQLKNAPAIDRKGIAAMTASVSGAVCAAFGRYDVVHFHAEGPAFMCWLPKLTGKRVVVTVHGLDHMREKWGNFARRYIMAGERNAVRYADEIIVLSENVQRYFQGIYGRKTHFIPNGVERPVLREAELIRDLGLEKDGYLLFLGRLDQSKGLKYLIRAFRKVQTGKKLLIAGSSLDCPEFVEELRVMAEGDGRIIFTGFVQGRMLDELYSNAYLYCLPSDLEGMPLTLLEAMSYGCCCLISDIPECTEVAEARAVQFRRGEEEELREKIQLLCDRPDLVEEYRKNAADFICQKYSWEDTVRRTLELYQGEFS